jgi:hypothetical protein
MPALSSAISTSSCPSSREIFTFITPVPVHGVYRVVHDVGPHLVESPAVRTDARQPLRILLLDRDALLELVGEDGERALQPLAHASIAASPEPALKIR